MYAASVLGTGKNAVGSGVITGDVAQLFNQGAINYTENSLDLAINGNGFFVTSNNGALSYTRAGYFGTDSQGNIVNNFGERLQGFAMNEATGTINEGVQTDLRVDTKAANPKATTVVASTMNLNSMSVSPTVYADALANPAAVDARAEAISTFDPGNSATYNSSTSVNIYDSQGNPHVMTKYFVKTSGNSWDMHVMIGGVPATPKDAPVELEFDSSGKLNSPAQPMQITGWDPLDKNGQPTGAADNVTFDLNLNGSTQYAASFAVTAVSQDGYTTGDLAGLEINDQGLLVARYTNGQTKVQGQLALATFANQQGLTPLGKTAWAQSSESGEPVIGKPGAGTLGRVQSGALEQSNVDLSEQLINLIVAQRNYQANSKTIQTEDAVTQTIINLR